ncbi:YigZ family protein [Aquisalimonas lutea]|uniref:IMPACT family protein n=1 Tax=Aquisalimonas lutea TaxID=1327750 RepID=UPI0025B3392F|nr:YigZ family protein [Aquisalimonas lutea]MDN3518028.1 YigZ family protein [Aquisalimonas lutea]
MHAYTIPAKSLERELVVRNSRFIARAHHAADRQQALARVAAARAEHPEARHHCWGFVIGDPAAVLAAAGDDDGEPSGTAARPILNVIQHKGIGDVVVVVVRYFGGVKLGAGGLTRAYARATEQVLAALPLVVHEPQVQRTVALDFASESALRRWAAEHDARLDAVRYSEGVEADLTLPEAASDRLAEFCAIHGLKVHSEPSHD